MRTMKVGVNKNDRKIRQLRLNQEVNWNGVLEGHGGKMEVNQKREKGLFEG